MFCHNCGTKLPEGSKFCGSCGAKVLDLPPRLVSVPAVEVTDEPTVPFITDKPKLQPEREDCSPDINISVSEEPEVTVTPPGTGDSVDNIVDEISKSVESEEITEELPEFDAPLFEEPPKKKSRKPLAGILIGAGALLIVAAALFAFRNLFARPGGDNAYIALSEGSYQMITDIRKGDGFEFDTFEAAQDATSPVVSFSPDGKYVYYFSGYNSSTYTGKLMRAEYDKLKENSSKNEDFIRTVDTDVYIGYEMLDSGKIVYLKDDESLWVFDGENTYKITDVIYNYYTDGTDRVAYLRGDYDSGYTLYGMDLNAIGDEKVLADEVSYFYNISDLDKIVYAVYDEDYSETVCVTGFDGNSRPLNTDYDTTVVDINDDGIYYMAVSDTASLYDFVNDSHSVEDANVKQPSIEDFSSSSYSYNQLMSTDDIAGYSEIYTTVTKESYFFSGGFVTMERAAAMDNTDDQVIIQFAEKYKSQENEDGYILVTDEIRQELQRIALSVGEGKPNEWLEMCFYKAPDGTAYYDYDAYYKALDEYSAVSNRLYIRDQLQDSENDIPIYSLEYYDFSTGSEKTVQDNILYARAFIDSLMYKTVDMEKGSIDIDELEMYWEIFDKMTLNFGEENYFYSIPEGATYRITGSAASLLAADSEDGYFDLYGTKNGVILSSSSGIYTAQISGQNIDGFENVSGDGMILSVSDDVLYYGSGYYNRGDLTFINVNALENGESRVIAADVMADTVNVYTDGAVIANTNFTYGDGYEITLFDRNANPSVVASGVATYLRVDGSTILYISNGDLYRYDGTESALVKSGVDSIWARDYSEIRDSFSGYGYYDNDGYGY
jgi:hypothetical protein